MLEAVCETCNETFIPADRDDLVHTFKDDQVTECGGTGIIIADECNTVRFWSMMDEFGDVYWTALPSSMMPYFMDRMELGDRVADHLNGPGEDQMLEDMIGGVKVNKSVDRAFWFSSGWSR